MNPIEFLYLDPRTIVSTFVLIILVFSLFLLFGALAVGTHDIVLSKILLAAILIAFAQWLIAAILSFVPVVGGMLGFISNLIAAVAIIKHVFLIQWKDALLIFVFFFVPAITTGIILSLFFGVDLTSFAQRLFFVA